MAPHVTQTRQVRLQFSLRGLLLAMLLVGVGITAYRWPWQVTRRHPVQNVGYLGRQWWQAPTESGFDPNVDYAAETVTTYRRDWRGKPVKDGLERIYLRGQLAGERPYRHDQLAGTLRSFDYRGRVVCEASYRENQAHGPFRIGDGKTWIQSGQYVRGQEQGEWRTIESREHGPPPRDSHLTFETSVIRSGSSEELPSDPIVCRSHWQNGKRHGPWEWRTTSGELLNAAEYANNRLVRWNGQPLHEPFQQWLSKVAASDPLLLAAMQLPCTSQYGAMSESVVSPPVDFFVKDGGGEAWMVLSGQTGMPKTSACYRVMHYARLSRPNYQNCYDELTIADFLLEWAVQEGLTFDFRYGELWLIPAGDCSATFRDPTGVDQIRFEPDSSQAREWEQLVVRSPYDVLFFQHTLRTLFQDTSIEVDFSDLEPVPQTLDPLPDLLAGIERPRREVLGLLLYRMGLQCEQQGNRIVIKRHWTGLESFRNIVNKNNSFSQ